MLSSISLLIFLIIIIIGEPSLLIYKSINGRNYPLGSVVKVVNGANLTLKCKDINNVNNEVAWRKKFDDLGFQEERLSNNFSKIIFAPVQFEDAGLYICRSLKFNVSKPILLTVNGDALTGVNRRLKRTQYGFDRYKPNNDLPALNVADPVGDFFKNNVRMDKPTPVPSWVNKFINIGNIAHENTEIWPGHGRPGTNIYTSNIASNNMPSYPGVEYEDLFKKTDNIVDPPDPALGNNEYGILYGIGIIGGLFLFGGIMCMCVRNNPNIRAHLDRASLSPACTHAMCVRHRDTNPLAGCILSNLNSTNRIPTPMVHTDASGDVTVLTFPDETIDDSTDYRDRDYDENLDAPPSYANTVDSTKCDLPPSYEEVIKTLLPPNYYSEQSPSVSLNN